MLCRRQLRGEVQGALLVTVRMLLSPEDSQELRPIVLNVKRASDLRVASQTQGKHLRRVVIPRLTVMYRHRPLSTLHRHAPKHTASVVVTLQDFLTMTAEVFLILALECVACRAQSSRENLCVPAGAMHHDLLRLLQSSDSQSLQMHLRIFLNAYFV